MNLFINFFQSASGLRQEELNRCLLKNIDSMYFDKVIIICDPKCMEYLKQIRHDKMLVCETPKRPSFNDFFRFTEKFPTDYNIIANSDIYFNDTLSFVIPAFEKQTKPMCMALTRWDEARKEISMKRFVTGLTFFNRPDSQDAWIFKGAVKTIPGASFSMGMAGCDNKIAYLLQQAGYKVINPSRTIQAVHMHASNVRTYNPTEDRKIIKAPFLTLQPSEI